MHCARRSFVEVDHLLPVSLQDLCLLEVINDLDGFPVELLASLPQWLRCRLLNNLPLFDLCRLDNSPVARGIDKDELWETRLKRRVQQDQSRDKNFDNPFQLNVGTHRFPSQSRRQNFANRGDEVDYVEKSTRSGLPRDKLLSVLASRVFSGLPCLSYLTSIEGDNLLQINGHPLSNAQNSYIWKKQTTALAFKSSAPIPRGAQAPSRVLLTPHRLAALCGKRNSYTYIQQLSLLANDCSTKPTSANIHINKMTSQILHAFYTGRYAQENGLPLSSRSKSCISSVNLILGRVESLKLQCDNYSSIGVLCNLLEAVTSEGEDCKLKSLYCVLPDVYNDIVSLLCRLFSLQNFILLSLEVDEAYLPSITKLIRNFMTAPCSHTQQLTINARKVIHFTEPLEVAELSTVDMGGATVPQCAVEHKILHLSPRQPKFTGLLHILLQFPTIRLNEIRLDSDYNYIHLCALHPNLLVTRLLIVMNNIESHAPITVRDDFVSLLKMPTLREIAIAGDWGHDKGVKQGLIEGLLQRATTTQLPLRKISLQVESGGCNTKDFRVLCDAIFSLPEVDQLEIALRKGFTGKNYIKTIHDSWVAAEVGIKLKLLLIVTQSSEFDTGVLSRFTQSYKII